MSSAALMCGARQSRDSFEVSRTSLDLNFASQCSHRNAPPHACCPRPRRVQVVLQPTIYWKNAAQQGLPFTLKPSLFYRGLGAALV